MKIIQPTFSIKRFTPDLELIIEEAGRTCYRSTDKICEGSAADIIPKWMNHRHFSVLEHGSITCEIVTDRGVMAELTRHRLASFSIESTRYCGYHKDKFDGEITVIEPFFFTPNKFNPLQTWSAKENERLEDSYQCWEFACRQSENMYIELTKLGCSAQEARSVLPNSLATTIMMTANPREWIHVFELRTHRDAHPQIRQVFCPMLEEFQKRWPILFSNIGNTEHNCPALELINFHN